MTTSTRLEAGNETGSERRAASASSPVSPGGEGGGGEGSDHSSLAGTDHHSPHSSPERMLVWAAT